MDAFSRRTLLKGLSAAAVAGAAGSALGCSAKTTTGTSGRIGADVLPTFAKAGNAEPALKSASPLGMSGYFEYPPNPVASVSKPPLSGGQISALTYTFDPVAPGKSDNPLWQEVDKRLGGKLDITYAPAADYAQRFATTVAGGDLPDLVSIYGSVQQLPALLKAKFTDLTEYLSGDAVKDYPNLAGLSTDSWRKTVYGNALWGVPIARVPIPSVAWIRADLVAGTGLPAQPKDIGEFKALLKGLTNERKSRWACGDPGSTLTMIAASLGIPGSWSEDGGKFTSNIELEEYEKALADTRELADAGVFHPDGLVASNNQRNDWFTNGTTPIVFGGYAGWSKYEMWGAEVPGFKLGSLPMFGYDAASKPVHPRGSAAQAFTAVTQAEPDRVREVLRVLDWLAAPFGSSEYLLRNFGIEGQTFTFEGKDPIVNSRGQNLRLVPFGYVSGPTLAIYDPGRRDVAQARFDYQEAALPILAPDPTQGLYSETDAAKGLQLGKDLTDTRNGILAGRAPVSSWKAAVTKWRNGGGDKIRSEFEQAFSEAGPK